jgi:hypothetical protein
MRALLSALRREDGSALMLVAIGLPVLLVVFAIVVDVGNWYVHRRALQNQVDAAVLAGSQLWGSCFKTAPTNPAWLPMQQEAETYDGQSGFAHDYNPQVGGSLKGPLGVAFNSTTFPLSQPPNVGPDDTPSDPCTPVTLADGRQHYVFDAKATEQNVPLVIGGSSLGLTGPSIHATARTELRQVESLSGLLPIGVQDPSPEYMYAQFVDENAGTALTGWLPLCKGGSPGCPAGSGSGQQLWTTPATTPVQIASANVGVRLKYVWAGSDSNPSCGSTALVDCFDAGSPNGLVHIRGWSTSAAAPDVHNAWLEPGTCAPDAYFASAPCSGGITAEVDLGTAPTASSKVWATVDGANQKYQLALQSTSGTVGTWTLAQGLPFTGPGPHTVALFWNCPTSNQGCPLGVVQRAFVADPTRSGPIAGVHVWSSAVTGGADSFAQGTTQNLGVAVDNPCFETEVSDPSCPLVYLRVATQVTGSQSQSLDCDPNFSTLRQEIEYGCSPGYTLFPKTAGETSCPTQTALWNSPNPPNDWECVAVQTGQLTGQVSQGLAARIGTDPATCANNWPDYPANDKRQVPLFLVPFTAFGGSGGNETYPVIGFGAFYITGYHNDPCPNATPNVPQGTVAGYFITYIPDGGSAKPSTKPCDPLALAPCVPVLVK